MKLFATVLISSLLWSCGSKTSVAEEMASSALHSVTCGDSKFLLLDDLKLSLLNKTEIPSEEDIVSSFKSAWLEKFGQSLSREKNEKILFLFTAWVDALELDQLKASGKTTSEKVSWLSAYDVEDKTNLSVSSRLSKKQNIYRELNQQVQSLDIHCESPTAEGDNPDEAKNSEGENPELETEFSRERANQKQIAWASYGARLVMATAYQNCHSLLRPELSRHDPEVVGIKVTGRHPNNVGLKREITRLDLVQFTHPYLSSETSSQPQCFDTFQTPLIYDFGGKPFVSRNARNVLNFHQNAGSGTDDLGIDCSGFVFSALATMGLRLQQGRELKALDVYSWPARSYMDPDNSGLTCLSKVTSTQNQFDSGTLIATAGHILMVDDVSTDPLGITRASSIAQCQTLNASHFNFTVIQSSNSKNGVGINRFEASDYFQSDNSMTSAMIEYQRAHCQAQFSGPQAFNNARLSIVRHRKEDQRCLSPRVKLAGESCVNRCPQL